MCGISAYINFEDAYLRIKKTLKLIESRGKDNIGLYNFKDIYNYNSIKDIDLEKKEHSKNILAHNLHSIVGNHPQPIISKNKRFVFISNQEIYNWKDLLLEFNLSAENDTFLLFNLLTQNNKVNLKYLNKLQGVWSFCLLDTKTKKIYISRDILGIKPLWYYFNNDTKQFAFCSEKKGLKNLESNNIKLLNPRHILIYDLNTNKLSFKKRTFTKPKVTNNKDISKNVITLNNKLQNSILKRTPDKKFGVLFSGGIDSFIIAKILKDQGSNFDLYFSYIKDLGIPKDLEFARNGAKFLNLKLIEVPVTLNKLKQNLKKVINIIESTDPIKVGVALPFYFACKKASSNKCKVLFSGLGADEIFAGYNRFKKSNSITNDSYNLLLQLHESNLYRDDVISMYNSIELRLPYLDLKIVDFALKLTKLQKINTTSNKIVLRLLGKQLNLPIDFYNRSKKAAQYGSNFDKAITKLSKINNFKVKSKYLNSLVSNKNKEINIGCLYSGGKDSNLALYIMNNKNYNIKCLLSIIPTSNDSYMFQKPIKKIINNQSKALNIPVLFKESNSIKEKELKDLTLLIKNAKEKYNLTGIACGAIFSNYQRERIQKICDDLQLTLFAPLWNMSQELELKLLLKYNFKFIICKISAMGLDSSILGKVFDNNDLNNLKTISKKIGFNIAGEGGEYETIVLDCPLFNKQLKINDFKIIEESQYRSFLEIKDVSLVSK